MNPDSIKKSWELYKTLQNSPEINHMEIQHIIEADHAGIASVAERLLRNLAIFTFLIAFCQNC